MISRAMSGATEEAKKAAAQEVPEAAADSKETSEEVPTDNEAEPELSAEEALQAQIAELEAKNAELVDNWKRSLADAENTRQMAQREIASAKKFAVQVFAKSMLDVCDNLALALEHTPADQREGDVNPQLKVLFEGVQMTEKILLSNLEKHGVTRFNPLDEAFDPNVMMALFEMPVEDKEPGTVAQVV